DSGLSLGSVPSISFADHPDSRIFGMDYSRQSSVHLPKPNASGHLAPLTIAGQSRDRRDSMLSYSFASDYPGPGRGSIDSEVDPLLPPLKRSRMGQSRLESIGELRLLRGVGSCLRCRALGKPVRPCSPTVPSRDGTGRLTRDPVRFR